MPSHLKVRLFKQSRLPACSTTHWQLPLQASSMIWKMSSFPPSNSSREKKAAASLPHHHVFSPQGTILYDSLKLPIFMHGFLGFFKEQPAHSQPALTSPLQLLMQHAATYMWGSVRSFHLSINVSLNLLVGENLITRTQALILVVRKHDKRLCCQAS